MSLAQATGTKSQPARRESGRPVVWTASIKKESRPVLLGRQRIRAMIGDCQHGATVGSRHLALQWCWYYT
jgi:hypothetical protein